MTKLSAETVSKLYRECSGAGGKVAGIVLEFDFDPAKIEAHKEQIRGMLEELPDEFRADRGGGWSFLNACQDRRGEQWTGFHMVMDELVCLGIAAGLADWLMKDMAAALPGGLPYFVVKV